MGSNKNKNQTQQYGTDPKGSYQTTAAEQTKRFNDQQGPLAQATAYNYGRGSEANYGDYTDIMNQYRDIASGGYSSGSGGGGGGGGYTASTVSPGKAGYTDPFNSYAGYTEFSQTGGYSPQDIANMRARGISPIRAAYANAERNVNQQRTLQGGYSPNAIATQAKMAREQGQSMADAVQNVEAGIAEKRNAGRLAGLGGMSGIEGQRLGADVDLSKFNTDLDYQAQVYNANAANQAAASGAASSAAAGEADMNNRFRALSGMTALYGTNPGMSETFGNQALSAVGQQGQFGLGAMNSQVQGQRLPGQWEQTTGRVNDIMDWANTGGQIASAFMNRNKQPQGPTAGSVRTSVANPDYFGGPRVNPGRPY